MRIYIFIDSTKLVKLVEPAIIHWEFKQAAAALMEIFLIIQVC